MVTRSPARPHGEGFLESVLVVPLVNDILFSNRELVGRANSRNAVERDRGLVIDVEDPVLTGVVGKATLSVVLAPEISITTEYKIV